MNRISLLMILSALITTLACSDFLNGKAKSSSDSNPRLKAGWGGPFPEDFDANAGEFSTAKMLANIGLNVIAPQTRNFRLQSELLSNEIQTLCTSLDKGEDAPALEENVKQQWTKAMLAYHRLDAVAFGPIIDNGRYLSDNIYSWPTTNFCGIDLAVVALSDTGKANRNLLYTVKGLAALEYLFFEPKLTPQCNPRNASHAPAFEWAKKSTLDKKQDRCQFARQMSEETFAYAKLLEQAWDPNGANFAKLLSDGRSSGSIAKSVNSVSDGLFGVETLKDVRLGAPLGMHDTCGNEKCPEMVENRWSNLSLKAATARLQGFRAVFLGSETAQARAFGFDDYLKKIGREDVSVHILEYTDKAVAGSTRADALGSFQDQIAAMDAALCAQSTPEERLVEVCAVRAEVRQVALKLMSEFLTALSLEAPPTHKGDND